MCILYYIYYLVIFFYFFVEIVELYVYKVYIVKKGGLVCLEFKFELGWK